MPPSNGAPRITTWASAYVEGSSRSHIGTPRKVKSGPNCWPYRVIARVFAPPEASVKEPRLDGLAALPSGLGAAFAVSLERASDRPEGPDRVDEGLGVLGSRPRRELDADEAGRAVDVDHLTMDAEAEHRLTARCRHEPELVAVPPAGQHLLVVRGSERGPDAVGPAPRVLQPARRDDLAAVDAAVLEQHPAEAGQVTSNRRDPSVVDPGSDGVAGDLGVGLGTHRLPEQGRDQLGHAGACWPARTPTRACRCRPSGR